MNKFTILGALVMGFASGCTMRTGDLNLLSTKNIASLHHAEVRGIYEGSDCKVFGVPNMKEAIDVAIERGNGNAMTDAALYWETGFFQKCFRAKGNVVLLKEEGGK